MLPGTAVPIPVEACFHPTGIYTWYIIYYIVSTRHLDKVVDDDYVLVLGHPVLNGDAADFSIANLVSFFKEKMTVSAERRNEHESHMTPEGKK